MRLKENQQEFMQYLIKKKLQSHSENKIKKWDENGHVLKQKNAFQFLDTKKFNG